MGRWPGFLGELPWLAQVRRTGGAQTGRLRVAGDAELAQRLQQFSQTF